MHYRLLLCQAGISKFLWLTVILVYYPLLLEAPTRCPFVVDVVVGVGCVVVRRPRCGASTRWPAGRRPVPLHRR